MKLNEIPHSIILSIFGACLLKFSGHDLIVYNSKLRLLFFFLSTILLLSGVVVGFRKLQKTRGLPLDTAKFINYTGILFGVIVLLYVATSSLLIYRIKNALVAPGAGTEGMGDGGWGTLLNS